VQACQGDWALAGSHFVKHNPHVAESYFGSTGMGAQALGHIENCARTFGSRQPNVRVELKLNNSFNGAASMPSVIRRTLPLVG
jgi:hypothetical protein